jgi:hypothetical protein
MHKPIAPESAGTKGKGAGFCTLYIYGLGVHMGDCFIKIEQAMQVLWKLVVENNPF